MRQYSLPVKCRRHRILYRIRPPASPPQRRPLPLLAGRQAPCPFHKRIWYIPGTVGMELNLLALLPKQGLINQTT